MGKLEHLLANNRRWSADITEKEPNFFPELAKQQAPEYLWIGCSDSRVSANTIVGLMPGEVFVHRNIANLVVHTDMNCLSVLQFAVDVLKVKHIIISGHYGCGGVQAALDEKRHGLIDNWLRNIQDTANLYGDLLAEIVDPAVKVDRLCELNVIEQVINTSETTIVQDAWTRGQDVTIHAWIYGLKDGILRDLDITLGNKTDLKVLRSRFLANGQPASAETA
ncbi:MAG TPA: carbonate dehydratase [Pyrinomonadaceae bacterium]|nr:carbonate dehydratase [Pyrinomonadaceae bacterium]